MWEYLFTTRPGIGWVQGTASITGVVLQVIICLMVVCSSTFVRRSGHFEVSDPYGEFLHQQYKAEFPCISDIQLHF